MLFWLNTSLIVISLVLITLIMLQQRGAGLSSTLGSEAQVYYTKRGAEKIIYIGIIVCAILFFGAAFARLFF